MTSDEASMKNQKLPKGYFYIPVDCLPKEKQINQNACSGEPLEHNGQMKAISGFVICPLEINSCLLWTSTFFPERPNLPDL